MRALTINNDLMAGTGYLILANSSHVIKIFRRNKQL